MPQWLLWIFLIYKEKKPRLVKPVLLLMYGTVPGLLRRSGQPLGWASIRSTAIFELGTVASTSHGRNLVFPTKGVELFMTGPFVRLHPQGRATSSQKKKNHKLYGSKILNSSLSYYPFDCCSCHQWNIAQWLCISYIQIQSIFLVTWDSYRWIGEWGSCQAFRRQKYGGFKGIRLQQRLGLYWRVHCPHKVQGGIKHYLSIKNKIQFIWRHCSHSVECSSEGRF